MERRVDNPMPRSGDRVIFARADGAYDVILIAASSLEETLGTLSTLELAREVARGGLGGSRVWWRHHLTPDTTEPFKVPTTA
jgi:hypothetical protein